MQFVSSFAKKTVRTSSSTALLIATIAIVVLVGISFFGTQISAWFDTLAKRITTNT